MSAAVKAELRHRMPGRLRAVLSHPLPPRDALDHLAEALALAEGVHEVEIRPRSGSIVIRHEGAYEAVSKALARAGLHIALPAKPDEPLDPINQTLSRIESADSLVKRWTGDQADIWSVSFTALIAGGLIQLARGQVAGPAVTLFGQAATLAMARPLRRFLG